MNVFNLREAIISKSKTLLIEAIIFFASILIYSLNILIGKKYFVIGFLAEIGEIWIILYALKSFFFNSKIGDSFNLDKNKYYKYFPISQILIYVGLKIYLVLSYNIVVISILVTIMLLITVFDIYFKYIYQTYILKIEYEDILKYYQLVTSNLQLTEFQKVITIKSTRLQIIPMLIYILLFSLIPSPLVIGLFAIYVMYKLYLAIRHENNIKLKYLIHALTLILTLLFIVFYILIDSKTILLDIFVEEIIFYSVIIIIPLFSYKIYYDNLFILYTIKFLIEHKGENQNIVNN